MGQKRALVVDDSKVGRLTMKKKLEAIGVVADLVESGQEALDYLAQQRPDMIFMDHMMPDMDGFETTRRIKSAPATQHIPIIVISGNDDEAFVQEARSTGAITAISKPPAAGVLEGILSSLPETVAAPAPAGVVEAMPQPVAVERRAAPPMDQAAVHAFVERMLGEVVEHLHSDLMAEFGKQMETALENERKALREWSEGWREQLDQTAAAMAELRHGAVDAESLRERLNAMEQRLLPLETGADPAVPDVEAVLEKVEHQVTARLAEFQAQAEPQATMWEGLRQELLAGVDGRHAQIEQSVDEMAGRLDRLAEDMKRLADGTLSVQAGHDRRFAEIEQRLEPIEHAGAAPQLEVEPLLAAMEERIAPQLAGMRGEFQARLEERSPPPLEEVVRESLSGPLREQHATLRAELEAQQAQTLEQMRHSLEAAMAAQAEGLQARIAEARQGVESRYEEERTQRAADLEAQQARLAALDEGWAHRLQALEQRFDDLALASGDAGAQGMEDMETVLAAMEERIAPRLAEMRGDFQARLEERSSPPLEEVIRESLSGPLREQQAALLTELEAQRARVQAMEQQQQSLEAALTSQAEGVGARIAEARREIESRYQQEQARLEDLDEGWAQRLQALEERLDATARLDIDAAAQRVLEQRIAQMREVVNAALQPDYPGPRSWIDEAPSAAEGGRLLQEIEAEVSDLRERLGETQLRHLISEAVADARPAAGAEHEVEERVAKRLADSWNERLRAEVARFEGKVKTLTVILAASGGALLAAVAMMVLLR